jgi:hypothetical protein
LSIEPPANPTVGSAGFDHLVAKIPRFQISCTKLTVGMRDPFNDRLTVRTICATEHTQISKFRTSVCEALDAIGARAKNPRPWSGAAAAAEGAGREEFDGAAKGLRAVGQRKRAADEPPPFRCLRSIDFL